MCANLGELQISYPAIVVFKNVLAKSLFMLSYTKFFDKEIKFLSVSFSDSHNFLRNSSIKIQPNLNIFFLINDNLSTN